MCPLSHDIPAVEREYAETWFDDFKRRMYLSTSPVLEAVRETAFQVHRWKSERPHARVIHETEGELERGADILLLSAYLQHFNTIVEIAKRAKARGIPVLLGGPMFNLPGTADAWRGIDGINAVVGAEADETIADMVEAICEGGNLLAFPGAISSSAGRAKQWSCAAVAPARRHPNPRLLRFSMGPLSGARHSDHDRTRLPVGQVPLLQ